MAQIKCDSIDQLFSAILQLQTVDECYLFFKDLTTVPELKSLAQRFQVALLLSENETYTNISQKTGASTATISRVKKELFYGADGYSMIIKRMKSQ